MDPLTQAVLGASVGGAVLGARLGRRAFLWGAILGAAPDLDVFLPQADPVEGFTSHRGFSHSLLVHLAVSPVLAGLFHRFVRPRRIAYVHWLLMVFLCLATHALLDACTVYGTQLFWPVTAPPVGWGFVFVIDPAYTLLLLFCVVAALWLYKRKPLRAWRFNAAGLALSTGYLAVALAVQSVVESRVDEQLQRPDVSEYRLLVTPLPFNIILWRAVAVAGDEYYEGVYSLFDETAPRMEAHPRGLKWLVPLSGHPPVQRLQWFTRGHYALRRDGPHINMVDLRMGTERHYAFAFTVGEIRHGEVRPVVPRRVPEPEYGAPQVRWLFWRIVEEGLPMPAVDGGGTGQTGGDA